jgi:hypothetical protein
VPIALLTELLSYLAEYNKLSKISIPEPRKYLMANFPEGLPLETCYIANSVIQQVDASVDHALLNNAWLDVTARLLGSIAPHLTRARELTSVRCGIYRRW